MRRPLGRFSDWMRQRAQRGRMTPERALGRRGEDYAHRYLQQRGYRIVARNYRSPSGGNEVDLIAWEGEHLVFVEVKARVANDSAAPERAVTPEKQRRIVNAALDYARRGKVEWGFVRFDVVAIIDGPRPAIELFRDAFGSPAAQPNT